MDELRIIGTAGHSMRAIARWKVLGTNSNEALAYVKSPALAREIARLTKDNEELRAIIHDAVGPTVAWASEWQNRNGTLDLHPQHQALIDRMTAAVNTETE